MSDFNTSLRNFDNTVCDTGLKDLFRGVKIENFGKNDIDVNMKIPDSFFQELLDYFMERSYLNEVENQDFSIIPEIHGKVNWIRITHLPVNPSNDESYDLLHKWQSVLATLHSWNYRFVFLLLRNNGETHLYLGTISLNQNINSSDAVEQLREAVFGSMPGIGLEHVQSKQTNQGMDMTVYKEIFEPLINMKNVGAITGIPSFRVGNDVAKLQTLDSLAFGIRDQNGYDRNYALLVIADPLKDGEIASLISHLRELGSRIHTDVSRSVNISKSSQRSWDEGLGNFEAMALGDVAGSIVGTLANILPVVGPIAGPILKNVAKAKVMTSSAKNHESHSHSTSASVSASYLNKYAEYAEQLIDKHIQRLKEGRNLGFWNTGIYVLGNVTDIRTVTGILRSVYSGQESYIEPIRTHLLKENSNARNIVGGFNLIPLIHQKALKERNTLENWHILGKPYQYLSTPMNTSELSLATSLPRRDVPGLRFVKTAVRFASNPAKSTEQSISLGNVVDMGVVQDTPYLIDPNIFVRHAFVCGITGCGKTTTCKSLISEVLKKNIPILIIEPAKDDYVRWAIEKNKTLPKDKQIRIYMPGGAKHYKDVKPLHMNLFQPAAIKGAEIDLLQHSENLSMLMNACLPSEEVIPILIDEAINRVVMEFVGDDYDPGDMPQLKAYPKIDGLIEAAKEMMQEKGYESKVKVNMTEILLTRFNYLKRGLRGRVFNVNKSIDYDELFSRPTIINISRLAGTKEKSLIMSMLLLALYEYRTSIYMNNDKYRTCAQKNQLMHLTLIEEAHNVLSAPPKSSSGDPRQAAADLFSNILSEIRGYGEGIVVVDQTPVKMIPDVIKNTNLKICHRLVAADDCELMAASLALRKEQTSMIPALEIGNAIVCGDMDDAAAWVRMPVPKNEKIHDSFRITI